MSAAPRASVPPARHLRILPIPDSAPPPVDPTTLADRRRSPYVQGTLAVDFRNCGDDPDFGPQATATAQLPDAGRWVVQMAQAVIETVSGVRSPTQLVRFTTPEVHASLSRRSAAAGRRSRTPGRRAIIRRTRVCHPADGVVEAAVVVVDNGRVRAMAMRLSGVDGRWLITALQLG